MTQPSSSAADESRTPPLTKDLDAVQVRYTWKMGDAGTPPVPAQQPQPLPEADVPAPEDGELAALQSQVRLYTAALEDIVTLALSNADYKERAIMMHRRAVAALSTKTGNRE
ncbi:MAG: hypothetical protein KY464_10740 [Gemmatimonadetes bacterium]|nr:hypothetical protein [Gemmatimonadota bacterium]